MAVMLPSPTYMNDDDKYIPILFASIEILLLRESREAREVSHTCYHLPPLRPMKNRPSLLADD